VGGGQNVHGGDITQEWNSHGLGNHANNVGNKTGVRYDCYDDFQAGNSRVIAAIGDVNAILLDEPYGGFLKPIGQKGNEPGRGQGSHITRVGEDANVFKWYNYCCCFQFRNQEQLKIHVG